VCAKSISGFIVIKALLIIIEHPGRAFLATGLVHELSGLVLLAQPKPAHPTFTTVRLPAFDTDVAARVQRRDELVSAKG
jgi:hypothetical protein